MTGPVFALYQQEIRQQAEAGPGCGDPAITALTGNRQINIDATTKVIEGKYNEDKDHDLGVNNSMYLLF